MVPTMATMATTSGRDQPGPPIQAGADIGGGGVESSRWLDTMGVW